MSKTLRAKALKQKKCKNLDCKSLYTPWKSTQQACSITCALKIVKQKQKIKYKAETRKMKKEVNDNSRSHQLKLTQTEFNKYIRLRDELNPCISCGTTANVEYCAGHYKTVGANPELRFCEINVHKQCNKNCNLEQSGNILMYRKSLINKIGLKELDWLEGPHEAANYTLDDIKEIRKKYKDKIKHHEQRIGE